jgi:hypothetical protein
MRRFSLLFSLAMRTAIVHYWLLGMRGGEKVVEALCRMLPAADIFTLFYDPERVSDTIRARRVTASYLNPLRRFHRSLLPFMPSALESFDLRGYDLVISSESGAGKGRARAFRGKACVLLSHAHALPVGALSGLSQRVDHQRLEARRDAAVRAQSAPVGLRFGCACRRLCGQQRERAPQNLENIPRESAWCHPPVAVETFFHRRPRTTFWRERIGPYKQLDYAVRAFQRTADACGSRAMGQSTGA